MIARTSSSASAASNASSELLEHPVGQRVELLRPVERQREDVVLDLVAQRLVIAHAREIPAPQGPHLGCAFEVERGRPRDRRRTGDRPHRSRGAACELGIGGRHAGEVERGRLDGAGRHRGPGQAELDGLQPGDGDAEQLHRVRGLPAGGAAEQRRVAAARMDADRQEAREQLGVLGDDAQVRGEREVEARADRAAADRRDRRRLERAHAGERVVDAAHGAVELGLGRVLARRGELRPVTAGAEERAFAGDDHGADRRDRRRSARTPRPWRRPSRRSGRCAARGPEGS